MSDEGALVTFHSTDGAPLLVARVGGPPQVTYRLSFPPRRWRKSFQAFIQDMA
jgi:hypothetical protein